jgi:miniconductance mechanosensitive channel
MAMIILVFKDFILGLVASIQIVANKLIRIGDRIEVPKAGADGFVLEISLSCVKVQNFDKTIIMIPTHSLLSQSFQNWSGIEAAGGRRIKRAILINIDSIKGCTAEMVQRFGEIDLISQYIQRKKKELESYNDEHRLEKSVVNSRRLTNLGTFRAYLEAYLSNHPNLNCELTFLVRQLQPTEFGLPLEIYAFCKDTDWVKYEAVQADIFDHVLSILPEFELSAFQGFSSIEMDKR